MNKIVIDTNVFISALMSRRGASFKLLSLIGIGKFEIVLSVSLALEYEDVAKRLSGTKILLAEQDIDDIIDYLCLEAHHQKIYYLWRPQLRDGQDDMVLEVAVSASCSFIVTYNVGDFRGVEAFGIEAITPKEFLERIEI